MQSDSDARTRLLDDSPRIAPSEYFADHGVPSAFCYFLDKSEDWLGFWALKRIQELKPAAPSRACRTWTGAPPGFGIPGSASQRVACARPCHPRRGHSRPKRSLQEGGRSKLVSSLPVYRRRPCQIIHFSFMKGPSHAPTFLRSTIISAPKRITGTNSWSDHICRTATTSSSPSRCIGGGLDCNAIAV